MLKFLSSKTNESVKRLIAFLLTLALIGKFFCVNSETILQVFIYSFSVLIALLLALATAETISDIFKK